jgi:hypothetical protein
MVMLLHMITVAVELISAVLVAAVAMVRAWGGSRVLL